MPTTSSGQVPPDGGIRCGRRSASFSRRASCSLISAASPGRSRTQAVGGRFAAAASARCRSDDRASPELRSARRRIACRRGRRAGSPRTSGRSRSQALISIACASSLALDIDVGGEPAVEPDDEGPAEAFDHGADADIDRQRQQQRHQRQRQARQLLAAVGPEPQRERPSRAALAERKHAFEHRRQQQRCAEQQRGQHGKSRQQRVAEPQQAAGEREDQRAASDALPCQPARAAPVARPAAAPRPAPAGGPP